MKCNKKDEMIKDIESTETLNKKAQVEAALSMSKAIYEKFSLDNWLRFYGEYKNIPLALQELLDGEGINGLTVCSLERRRLDFLRGRCTDVDFMRDVEALFVGLNNEMSALEELDMNCDFMKERN